MFKPKKHIDLSVITGGKTIWEVTYPVMEHFFTIQGEGAHTGKSAYFIRLAGCDVGCHWCDVKDSWDASLHPDVKVTDLVRAVDESGTSLVVITGGEPLLHNLVPLTLALKQLNVSIHLETSGSSELTGYIDWVTLSPKRLKEPLPDIYKHVDELKVVVLRKKDLQWAEHHSAFCPSGTRLMLQPEWDTPNAMPLIVDYVKKNNHWQISLQTHKYLGVR